MYTIRVVLIFIIEDDLTINIIKTKQNRDNSLVLQEVLFPENVSGMDRIKIK